jgi:hypothetical protein
MLSAEENKLLTSVGPEMPMGTLLRAIGIRSACRNS